MRRVLKPSPYPAKWDEGTNGHFAMNDGFRDSTRVAYDYKTLICLQRDCKNTRTKAQPVLFVKERTQSYDPFYLPNSIRHW
ncbi:6771_t:CDS:1, partial [Acaulospora colombiana]